MTDKTARQAYNERRRAIGAKIVALSAMLEDYDQEFLQKDAKDWGYVGTLAHIDELLGRCLGEE